MDFKNVSIIVKAIFLILFCIQMISSVLASESATFAQIIAATEVAYVLQKTYNSSMIVEPIEQDYVDGLSIKPPNRYGHTMIRRGKLFGGTITLKSKSRLCEKGLFLVRYKIELKNRVI